MVTQQMEAHMKQSIRKTLVILGLIVTCAGGGYSTPTLKAEGQRAGAGQTKGAKEGHPILQNSIKQIEGVRDRLQKAPWDFGGHKEAAIDSLSRALNELHQAEQFDKK
jgi:hypothetical protein